MAVYVYGYVSFPAAPHGVVALWNPTTGAWVRELWNSDTAVETFWPVGLHTDDAERVYFVTATGATRKLNIIKSDGTVDAHVTLAIPGTENIVGMTVQPTLAASGIYVSTISNIDGTMTCYRMTAAGAVAVSRVLGVGLIGTTEPTGLAVDVDGATQMLYWTDWTAGTVHVFNFTAGTIGADITLDDLTIVPLGISLESTNKFVFSIAEASADAGVLPGYMLATANRDGTLTQRNPLPLTFDADTASPTASDKKGYHQYVSALRNSDGFRFILKCTRCDPSTTVLTIDVRTHYAQTTGTEWAVTVNGSDDRGFCALPPQPTTPVRYIRRVRRFPLPFDNGFWVYISRLELIVQPGMSVSSGQGSNAMIQVRFSQDGGQTWGNIIEVPLGRLGEYLNRPVINRIGKLRNGICEIAVSDPVRWYMLGCTIEADESHS